MHPPFRIKICGITSTNDALHAVAAGADALGLNFYAKSPRSIDASTGTAIARSLPDSVASVGVFVNETVEVIRRLSDELPLRWIQLHGDEPPEMIGELAPRRVIRAFRCTSENIDRDILWLAKAESLGHLPAAILVDAFQPGQFGGTGKTVDVGLIAPFRTRFPQLPVILAGGLKPDNVELLILAAQPDGVDTASGVEQAPGKKDSQQVTQFVQNAKRGFKSASR